MNNIIVITEGGVVTGVLTDSPEYSDKITIIDHDELDEGALQLLIDGAINLNMQY